MVRSSFSTLFFIRENRVRKDGTTIIEVLITVNGERCGFSTGKKVKATSWDKTKQQVKGKDEEAKSLNNYLKAVKAKLYQKEAELLGRGFIITAKLLCEAYQEKIESLKEKSLFEVFTEHNHEQEKLIWHYKIFCVNGKYGIQVEFRIFYFIALQNEEDYERKESSSAR